MQGHVGQITIEHAMKEAERVFVDSIKEEYENSLPNAVITVYMKNFEIDEKGASSGFMFNISDDTVTEEELEHQLRSRQESLTQRFLDKAATYPDSKRNPDVNNRIRFSGLILEIGWDISSIKTTELSEADKSEFIEIAKIGIKRNKKDWDQFWDKIGKITKLLSVLRFFMGDTDIIELINFLRDKIEDADVIELIKKFISKK